MMIYLPLIVCIIGAVVYATTKNNAELKEMGHDAFWCGLLVTLFQFAYKVFPFTR